VLWTRHGSTWDIAEVITHVLSAAGGTVTLRDIEEVENVAGYDVSRLAAGSLGARHDQPGRIMLVGGGGTGRVGQDHTAGPMGSDGR
jgi:hypothetical protein